MGFEMIGMVASLAGSMMSAMGAMQQADAQAAQLEAEAIRKEQQAGQERAASQHKAEQKKLETDRLISEQNAIYAASGGGVVGSAVDVMSKTRGRGELNSETALYEGEAKGRSLEDDAAIRRAAASSARDAGSMKMFTGILSGISGFAKPGGMMGGGGSDFRYAGPNYG